MTPRQGRLALHEEIMLLALRDEEGTTEAGTMYTYAIGGTLLAELLLHERVAVDGSTNKKLVNIVNAKPLDHPLLDDCLTRIRVAKKRASVRTWVSRLAGTKDLKHRIAQQLCEQGILRAASDKVLLIFSRRTYPEIDPVPEKELIGRLREAIFTDTDHLDPRTVILVSLASSTGLLKTAFDKKDLKVRKQRIERIVNGEVIGEATQQAIAAVQAALFVTCFVPTMITTTTTH